MALLLVIGACVALTANARQYGEANDKVEHTHEVLDQLNQVRTTLLRGGMALRNYALIPQEESIERLRSAAQEARRSTQALQTLVQDNPEQSARAAEVHTETHQITGLYLASVLAAERDDPATLRHTLIERISKDGARQVRQVLDTMEHAERSLLSTRRSIQERERQGVKQWSIGLVAAFMAFMLWTLAYSTRLVRLGDRDMKDLATSADTDALTGLSNRRALARKVQQLQGRPMSVVVFDLDDFKPVNDRYGHAAGDEVLRTVGRRLKEQCRDADLVARVGGDEFVVLFPGLDDNNRMAQIEARLKQSLGAPIKIGSSEVTVGTSIGYASTGGDLSWEALVEIADDMSYAEKKRKKTAR